MTARLSNRKYFADIVFLDGSKRTIEYDAMSLTAAGAMFDTGDMGIVLINIAATQSIDTCAAAQTAGAVQ